MIQAEQDNPEFNLISVSAAWNRLAQLQRSISTEMTNGPSFRILLSLTRLLLDTPSGLARAVANTLWATARLQGCVSLQLLATLWNSLAHATKATANDMNEQDVANSFWAVATLATTDEYSDTLLSLLPALAGRVPSVMSKMTAQAVSNVIWAVAKLVASEQQSEALLGLLPALAKRVPTVITEMTTQAVGNVMWATGQLSIDSSHAAMSQGLRDVLPSLAARALVLLPKFDPQALANSCWGLALSNYHDALFFESVAARVASEAAGWQLRLAELTLPSVLCSFARLSAAEQPEMLNAAAGKLNLMLSKMNDWGLCATLWSYQQLDRGDDFLVFRQRLESEVARRQLSNEDVKRSRLGPEAWRIDAKEAKGR